MTDKKKKYLTPEMTVIEIEAADIIATSTKFGINPDEGYEPEQPW